MEKTHTALTSLALATSLALSQIVSTPVVQAHELDPQIQGPLVLAEAMYYDAGADEVRLDEGKIDHDRVTAAEVNGVQAGLANLSDEQIDQVLADNGYESEDMRQPHDMGFPSGSHPQSSGGGVAVLGILAGGGLIFYAMYTSHSEKQNLVNQCYDNGGTPVIDSRDSAGVKGTTDSGAAKQEGGYRFECQK